MTINHGIPSSPFFLIALPASGKPMGDMVRRGTKEDPYIVATLNNPKNGESAQAEIHSMWRFSLEEPELLNSWAKLAYGITGPQLLTLMNDRYKGFKNEVEFILLKKVTL